MGSACGKVDEKKKKDKEAAIIIQQPIIVQNEGDAASEHVLEGDILDNNKNNSINHSIDKNQAQTHASPRASQRQDRQDQAKQPLKSNKPQQEEQVPLVKLSFVNAFTKKEIYTERGLALTKKFKEVIEDAVAKGGCTEGDIRNFRYYLNSDKHVDQVELEIPINSEKSLEELFVNKDDASKKTGIVGIVVCITDLLQLSDDPIQCYVKTNLLGKPSADEKNEALTVIISDKKDSSFRFYQYYYSDFPYVAGFSEQAAYCNAIDNLFIAGGEDLTTGEVLNIFYAVDLKKNIVSLVTTLIEPRSNHSMIFVPNKYIFIVGGNNQKSVELYDIEENDINIDSHLNDLRSETTLCLMNNHKLFAFCGYEISIDFILSFEVCNISLARRTWEKQNFKYSEGVTLDIRFFSVSYYGSNDKIVFLGGTLPSDALADKQYVFSSSDFSLTELKPEKAKNYAVENFSGERFFIPTSVTKDLEIHSCLLAQVSGSYTLYSHCKSEGVIESNFSENSTLERSLLDNKQEVNKEEIKLKFIKDGKVVQSNPIKRELEDEEQVINLVAEVNRD